MVTAPAGVNGRSAGVVLADDLGAELAGQQVLVGEVLSSASSSSAEGASSTPGTWGAAPSAATAASAAARPEGTELSRVGAAAAGAVVGVDEGSTIASTFQSTPSTWISASRTILVSLRPRKPSRSPGVVKLSVSRPSSTPDLGVLAEQRPGGALHPA